MRLQKSSQSEPKKFINITIFKERYDGTADEAVNDVGFKPTSKADRGLTREAGRVASPQASMRDVPKNETQHGKIALQPEIIEV
jgi:hypothetical protein